MVEKTLSLLTKRPIF